MGDFKRFQACHTHGKSKNQLKINYEQNYTRKLCALKVYVRS